jgi:dTDP-4-amino-4,6-dideoxygalactose transaminase
MTSKPAILGGTKAITTDPGDMFTWPIITQEDEDAIVKVLHDRAMSAINITQEFEKKFAEWQGCEYALGFCNGTMSVLASMFAVGLGHGDEIIVPSINYWAAVTPAYLLGATPVFADIEPDTMCLDPNDIERCVSKKTKGVLVVHYLGHPANMDGIMAMAKKFNLKVIEDVSHAQGGYYKGKKLGNFGDVSAFSLMSGKSFAVGEGGMLATNNLECYERAIAAAHHERFGDKIITPDIAQYKGLPLLGLKGRMNQFSSAMGITQLKYYDERTAEIRKSLNYFWDLLEGVPGIRPHRVLESEGSTMGGWYYPHGLYKTEELGGLSISRFCRAVREEGADCCSPGCNNALHTHGIYKTADIFGHGKPTRIANADRDVRELDEALPHSMVASYMTFEIPWFKHFRPDVIKEYAEAYKKTAYNYKELLADDPGNPESIGLGRWYFFRNPAKK